MKLNELEKETKYDFGTGLLLFFIFVILLTYPKISKTNSLNNKYLFLNIFWSICVLIFLLWVYPYLLKPYLFPKKIIMMKNGNINSNDIVSSQTIGHSVINFNTLPRLLPTLSGQNPIFNFDEYSRLNQQDTRELDITVIISKPKPINQLEKWINNYSLAEVGIYNYFGEKIQLDLNNTTATSEDLLNPLTNLFDNDLTTYYYTSATKEDEPQTLKFNIGKNQGISRIILVNKLDPNILQGMRIQVLGVNQILNNGTIPLLDYFIQGSQPIENIIIDRITGSLRETNDSVINYNLIH